MEECRKGLAWERLAACVPFAPSWKIDWIQIAQAGLGDLLERMKEIPQNPLWHGEGSVWQHTCMVCEELVRMEKFRRLERKKQVELFVAAILHDIGKLVCTRQEDGVWFVEGPWLQRTMANVNFADYESRMWFDKNLRESGLFQRLEEMGIQDGDTVSMYDWEFEYQR